MKAPMAIVSKAAGRKKSAAPRALGAVARQQLVLINGLLDEVSRNYLARLHREINGLIRVLEEKQAGRGFSNRETKDLQDILKQIQHLHIDSEKGRRKDLKKIDALIGDLQSTVEKW
jgi:hypothetical protein